MLLRALDVPSHPPCQRSPHRVGIDMYGSPITGARFLKPCGKMRSKLVCDLLVGARHRGSPVVYVVEDDSIAIVCIRCVGCKLLHAVALICVCGFAIPSNSNGTGSSRRRALSDYLRRASCYWVVCLGNDHVRILVLLAEDWKAISIGPKPSCDAGCFSGGPNVLICPRRVDVGMRCIAWERGWHEDGVDGP